MKLIHYKNKLNAALYKPSGSNNIMRNFTRTKDRAECVLNKYVKKLHSK